MAQDLPLISGQKYNRSWCEKRPLVYADQDRMNRACQWEVKKDLSPAESAAFFLHELTGCEGLEFVAFSNARLTRPVTLVNDVALVPCFLDDIDGHDIDEPLVWPTLRMARERRFLYDGWVPIRSWKSQYVREAVRGIDEALALCCLRGRTFFQWEPKYPSAREAALPHAYYNFEDRHLRDLEAIAGLLSALPEDDRVAVYRSIGWLSQASRLDQPAARFLFCIFAIESLATYIETKAPAGSPLARLKAGSLTDEGIAKRVRTHLERLFTPQAEPVILLFKQRVARRTLYDLRHKIAHGGADTLSAHEMEHIRQRIWDVERIAAQYILSVFKKALGMQPLSEGITASRAGLGMIVSSEDNYQGPTHMALLYF
jgi:hypothetical protein